MGEFCVQKKLYDDAFRFVTAGLVMADTEKNINYARSVSLRIKSDNKKQITQNLVGKFQDVLYRESIVFKAFRAIARLIIFLIPIKRYRSYLRKKLNI
jgi:hypothetical protein